MRPDTRTLAHDDHVHVRRDRALIAEPSHHVGDHLCPSDARPFGGTGKQHPDVGAARCGQQGVTDRMRNDVAIGVAGEAGVVLHLQCAEHQGAARLQAVRIGAHSNPQSHVIATCSGSRARKRVIVL